MLNIWTLNKQMDIITKKANITCAFLRRNISSCSKKVKAQCYPTVVRPNVEYAATVWDPHTKQNTDKLEQLVQSDTFCQRWLLDIK